MPKDNSSWTPKSIIEPTSDSVTVDESKWKFGAQSVPLDVSAVAAIVEEANHLIYSVGKARISTLLEALLGKSSIGSDPAGKLLTYTLEEMQRLVTEAAQRHVPGLTAEMLTEAGAQRRRSLVAADRKAVERRIADLTKEIEWAKEDLRVLDDNA